jgi:hypothetical protein
MTTMRVVGSADAFEINSIEIGGGVKKRELLISSHLANIPERRVMS